jgi:uncharacterized protein YjbI with pentapeptide repeats
MPEPMVADQPPEASASSAIEPAPTEPSALVGPIKSLLHRIVRWGDKSDFVKILELAGKFGLVAAVASYLLQIPAQRQAREDALKAKRYQAWALINSAQGSAADGGRLEALQDLSGDGVILAGANLANAHLSSIKLPKADLSFASLQHAYLDGADLSGALLFSANLGGAHLISANFTNANLISANLSGADLFAANLTGTYLTSANLGGAHMSGSNLTGADLTSATDPLTGAHREGANLNGANLSGANLSGAKISQMQLDVACGSDAKLPPGLTLKPCPPQSPP